jgi:hypothetical protein
MAEDRCREDRPRSHGRIPPPDSPHHVFAAGPAKEGCQEAQLLERRGEPPPWDRPRCATPRLVSGRDQPVPGRGGASPSKCSTKAPGIRGPWRCFLRIAPSRVHAGGETGQSPLNSGLRFSRKALTASRWSSVAWARACRLADSSSRASRRAWRPSISKRLAMRTA